MPDKKQILNSIAAIAKKLGRAPSRAEFTARSGISAFFVLQWFRSWSDAVRAAGLRPYTRNAKVEDRALLEDWGNTVRTNRGELPRHIYRRKAKYNPCTLANRFGGWTSVPEAFCNFAKGKQKWADVLALLPVGKPKEKAAVNANLRCSIPPNKAQHAQLQERPTYCNPIDFR